MLETSLVLKKAAEKSMLVRTTYTDKKAPSNMSETCVLPFFGDMRSTVALSAFLLRRYRQESKGSKYFIMCSWGGMDGLFPCVDEYWSLHPEFSKKMYLHADGMDNNWEGDVSIRRSLNYFFEDVVEIEDLKKYYENSLKKEFFDRFGSVKCWKPMIASSAVLGSDFNRDLAKREGRKIVIFPSLFIDRWKNNRIERIGADKEFWIALVKNLLDNGYNPVVISNEMTHDISPSFMTQCVYLANPTIDRLLTAMRSVGCVLDVYSGISRLATMARCPFVACDERNRYNVLKEFEFDDLCGNELPYNYIFSFPTIISQGDAEVWKYSLFDIILKKLNGLFSNMSRDSWPSTSESEMTVPYSVVRKTKASKFGARFVRVPKI